MEDSIPNFPPRATFKFSVLCFSFCSITALDLGSLALARTRGHGKRRRRNKEPVGGGGAVATHSLNARGPGEGLGHPVCWLFSVPLEPYWNLRLKKGKSVILIPVFKMLVFLFIMNSLH